jgi:hypothetical protein
MGFATCESHCRRSTVSFLAIPNGEYPERACALAAFFRETDAEITDPQALLSALTLERL